MKKMIMSAMLISSMSVFAQNSANTAAETTAASNGATVAKASSAGKAANKKKKAQKKKSAQINAPAAQEKAAINEAAKVEVIAPAAAQGDSATAAAAQVTTTATATTAAPEVTKKWGGEITLTGESTAKLAWQDAEQSITGYAAVKYKQDKLNAFAIRQYGMMTMPGSNSAAGAVSTGRAGNTMFLYTRGMGSMFKSDDASTIQYRLTLPTNDQSGFDIAALSATMTLPYTISPKWSAEYGLRLGMGFNKNIDKNSISSTVNNGQIAYSFNDKLQVYQSLGVTNGNLRTIDSNRLNVETGITFIPVSSLVLQFAVAQEHGIGAGATEYKLYNVDETSYNSLLVMNF